MVLCVRVAMPRRFRTAVASASVRGSANTRSPSGNDSVKSVTRLSGNASGPHHATRVSRSNASCRSVANLSNATDHEAATDAEYMPEGSCANTRCADSATKVR